MEKLHIFKRMLCLAMVMAIIGSLLGVGGIASVAAEEHSYDDLNLDGIFNEAPAPGIPESSDSNQSSNTVVKPRGSVDTGSIDDDAELSFIESNITVEAGETKTLVAMYNSADVALADADVVVSFTGGSAGSILFGEPVVTPISTGAKSGMVSVEATFIVTGTFVITLEAGADSSNPDTMASTKMEVTVEEASTVSGTPSIKAYAVNGADSVKVGGNVSVLVTYYNGAAIDAKPECPQGYSNVQSFK